MSEGHHEAFTQSHKDAGVLILNFHVSSIGLELFLLCYHVQVNMFLEVYVSREWCLFEVHIRAY